ncbi:MAG: hypothetical protein KDD63_12465, partial [Bacteroidetes bacterium]|nr:hypothetical protein [Bacteroidota bacterium]
RFTDLVNQSLSKSSSNHHLSLLTMIEHILTGINNPDIRGLKMILEVYLDILEKTNQSPPESLGSKFSTWKEKKNLLKVLNLIEEKHS